MVSIPKIILGEECGSKVDQKSAKIQQIVSHLDECRVIIDFQKLGGKSKQDTARPRTVLMTHSSLWEARKVMAMQNV